MLAIDACAGTLYWTCCSGAIRRANLDGTDIEVDVVPGASARHIDLDVAAGKLDWVDPAGGAVWRANLDGTHVEAVVIAPNGATETPFNLAVDGSGANVDTWRSCSVSPRRRAPAS